MYQFTRAFDAIFQSYFEILFYTFKQTYFEIIFFIF